MEVNKPITPSTPLKPKVRKVKITKIIKIVDGKKVIQTIKTPVNEQTPPTTAKKVVRKVVTTKSTTPTQTLTPVPVQTVPPTPIEQPKVEEAKPIEQPKVEEIKESQHDDSIVIEAKETSNGACGLNTPVGKKKTSKKKKILLGTLLPLSFVAVAGATAAIVWIPTDFVNGGEWSGDPPIFTQEKKLIWNKKYSTICSVTEDLGTRKIYQFRLLVKEGDLWKPCDSDLVKIVNGENYLNWDWKDETKVWEAHDKSQAIGKSSSSGGNVEVTFKTKAKFVADYRIQFLTKEYEE